MKVSLSMLTVGSIGVVLMIAGCQREATPAKSGGGEASSAATVTVVNGKCPIMGEAIDRTKVPASLAVDFEGQKVGFCCGQCPAQWRALSDEEKRTRLRKAMDDSPPATETHQGHQGM